MRQVTLAVAATLVLTISACSSLPPGHVPLHMTAAEGGGEAFLAAKHGIQPVDPSYLP